jgi:hypothetical protein
MARIATAGWRTQASQGELFDYPERDRIACRGGIVARREAEPPKTSGGGRQKSPAVLVVHCESSGR